MASPESSDASSNSTAEPAAETPDRLTWFLDLPIWPLLGGLLAVVFLGAAGLYAYDLFTSARPDETRSFEVEIAGESAAVRVDCFFPEQDRADLPAVLWLHGVEGTSYYLDRHYTEARELASRGYAVFFVRYFDPQPYADRVLLDASWELDVPEVETFLYGEHRGERLEWAATVRAAVRWADQQPESAPGRLAITGVSLGGFLALSVAHDLAADDSPIQAVAVLSACKFRDETLVRALPPVEMHHGVDDRIVEIEYARQTRDRLIALGGRARMLEYPEQGHVLEGLAAEQSRARVQDFLDERLRLEGTASRP